MLVYCKVCCIQTLQNLTGIIEINNGVEMETYMCHCTTINHTIRKNIDLVIITDYFGS